MNIILNKGLQGQFAEIEIDGIAKRFFVPEINNFQARLQTLIQQHPKLSLVRTGSAIITNVSDVISPYNALGTLPSKVNKSLSLDFLGNHPFVAQGTCNYSEEFVQQVLQSVASPILEQPAEQGQTSVYDHSAVQETVLTQPAETTQQATSNPLTQQLMAQVKSPVAVADAPQQINMIQQRLNAKLKEQQKSAVDVTLVPDKQPVLLPNATSQTEPLVSETQKTLDMLKEQRQTETPAPEQAKTLEQAVALKRQKKHIEQPKGKLDVLIEQVTQINSKLDVFSQADELTGADIKMWLDSHIEEYGEEKAYELLAKRIRF